MRGDAIAHGHGIIAIVVDRHAWTAVPDPLPWPPQVGRRGVGGDEKRTEQAQAQQHSEAAGELPWLSPVVSRIHRMMMAADRSYVTAGRTSVTPLDATSAAGPPMLCVMQAGDGRAGRTLASYRSIS